MISNAAVTTSGSTGSTTRNSNTGNQDLTIAVAADGSQVNNHHIVPNSHTTASALNRNPRDNAVRLRLQEEELWHEFYAVGNEMIVTKPGRRMYPYVVVTPYNMKAGVQYQVSLRIVPVDNKRYKYTNGVWHAVGGSDAVVDSTRMSFKHPTTPALGEHLNGKPLIFKHAKLTHVRENKEHILVRTMHKYMAVIDVSEVAETVLRTITYVFLETSFIAVTSYLSSQLTSLKIRHNPFARGIQDRAQLSITNGDSDFTDDDDDILPPILSSHPGPSSLLTANMAMPPYLPLVQLPPPPPQQQSSSTTTTSSSYVPLLPTLSVPQIFSYTSACSHSQASSCVSAPSVPQESSGISSSVAAFCYTSGYTLPHYPIPPPSFPFCPTPPVSSSQPQDNSGASGSSMTQDLSFVARLPQWPSYIPPSASLLPGPSATLLPPPSTSLPPATSYITTPSGRHHFYSQVSWPYPYPPIPHHRLPSSTESFKMTHSFHHAHSFHPYLPYPSSAAPYYPSTTTTTTTVGYPVYYNTNYRPNMQ